MKANRKFINEKEAGVSEVIGVILMVAITVAITITVYVYVTQHINEFSTEKILCGHINHMPERQTTDILIFNGIIYIVEEYGISDKDYAIMNYAYDNNCNCTITLREYWNTRNTYDVIENSAYLLGCGTIE
jgi:hypothetical protein